MFRIFKKKENKLPVIKVDDLYFKMICNDNRDRVLRVSFVNKDFILPNDMSFLYNDPFILKNVTKTYIEENQSEKTIEISNEYHYEKNGLDMTNINCK